MKIFFEMKKNNRVARNRYKLNLNIPRTNQVASSLMVLLTVLLFSNTLCFNIKKPKNIVLLQL